MADTSRSQRGGAQGRNGESRLQAQLRSRADQIRRDMNAIAHNALLIAQALEEVLENGGRINIDPQMNFITGAHARALKDLGVVGFLQSEGATVRSRPGVRPRPREE